MKSFNRLSGTVALVVVVTVASSGCAEMLAELGAASGSADASTPTDGLREALRVGTARAVDGLGRTDGYLKAPDVRIPVPEKLSKLSKALETLGAGDYVDEFVTGMNRAAEAAAPVARDVFVDSIREMTFDDALTILRGRDHEATDYFREHAGPRLASLFRPIVDDKLAEVGATRSFNALMDQTRKVPFVDRPAIDLTEYVTERALDGLFLRLAGEEERIRRDPVARTTELLKKWFGPSAS
jgi:hypothetical protein